MRHFPFDTYGKKWRDRKGRAIHTQSDFMRPLCDWGDTLFANAVKMSLVRNSSVPSASCQCDRLVDRLTPSFARRVPQYFLAKTVN
jgi:hypothetical protein